MRIRGARFVALNLAVLMFLIGISPRVEAGFSPSEIIATAEFDRAADLNKVREVLEIKTVRERLQSLGLTDQEINLRLGQLTDSQLHQLAQNVDELKVGGNGLGVVIALLVIAILIVLLLQLTGHRVIVK